MSEPEPADRGERFMLRPGRVTQTQCHFCDHYAPGRFPACRAYPGIVPQAILSNDVDHRLPYEGDQGIRFAAAPDADPADLAALDALFTRRRQSNP